ncbi:MAG: hypothetical protein AAB409_09380 [Gemmatimonadota bacterium]
MTMRISPVSAGLLVLALGVTACEPASVTAAREQLGRGGSRSFSLALPIAQDTFLVGELLPKSDTATTTDGLLAIKLDPESLTSAVGSKLRFDNLTFQQFKFSYGQMLSAAPDSAILTASFAPHLSAPAGPVLPAPPAIQQDTIRFITPQGSSVSRAAMQSGLVIARITNGTWCSAIITETLQDSTGATVLSFPANTVPSNGTAIDTIDASGASFEGYLFLGTPTITPLLLCVPLPGQAITVRLNTTTLTLASVTLRNIRETFSETDSILANEPRIGAVDTVVVNSGSFTLTVQNRLPITDTINIQLNGVTRGGAPLTSRLVIPAAPGDGSYRSASTTLDLAGTMIRPAVVVASVTGVASAGTATISSAVTTDAVIVDGSGSLVIESVAGRLDPTKTPELTVALEEFNEIDRAQVDFGDLEDAVKGARLNNATGALTIRNTAQTPLVLSNVNLGVVKLNAAGALLRDGSGNPVYERDSTTNQPILVRLAPAGQTQLTLPRAGTAALSLQMAPLVDRLVHLLLDNTRCAVVAAGSAVAGDGSPSRITRNDSASVLFQLTVGLDISLPDTGIVFTRTEYADGADLEPRDSATVVNRLISGAAIVDVLNGTPFGLTVDVAIVRDSVPSTTDVFAAPGRVLLGPITVAAATVDTAGRVVTPAPSSQSVTLTGNDVRVLVGLRFTTGVRIRLRPPPGGGRRGALRATDRLIVNSHASIELRAGGGQ